MEETWVVKKPARVVSLSEHRAAKIATRESRTLQNAWDAYQANQGMEAHEESSRRVYRQVMREVLEGREGVVPLPARPSTIEVKLWVEDVARVTSPATANKYLAVLKAVVERARYTTRDIDLRDIIHQVKRRKLAARERRDAAPADVTRILATLVHPLEILATRLGAFYGLRSGEVLGLEPSHVRDDYGTMRVTVSQQRGRDGVRPRKNALNGKAHVLTIADDEPTRALLVRLCDERERVTLAGRGQKENAARFLIPWGHDYPRRLVNQWKEAGLAPSIGDGDAFHSLRHFGATALASDPQTTMSDLQAWLGDSTDTAARTYMGQVRGTTAGNASRVMQALARTQQPEGGPMHD